ncbi:MAG: thioredoxin domain-containing protein [Acidipila sp.]|nr:thioredoxin domain-containing protein [Acidipila sp.]
MSYLRLATFVLLAALSAAAQTPKTSATPAHKSSTTSPGDSSVLSRRVERYLRTMYAWGPQYVVKIGAPAATPVPGLLQVSLEVSFAGDTNSGQVFVSSDGRFIVQGELSDMTGDPFAAIRQKINLDDAASEGPADARVVVVEYGDFQCPSCRQLQQVLKPLRPNYPQVRFVFRDFPLTHIHAWAMTASLGGRCVLRQNPAAFWTYFDAIYDAQDLIKPETAYDKVLEQAATLGVDQAAFKTCMAAPETKSAVERSIQEGIDLKIANTPTVFVNGRRMVGGDRESLEQYIQFELAAAEHTKPAPTKKP